MTYDPRESLTLSASDLELERRWKTVRGRMEAEGIDVLVIQNHGAIPCQGGRWRGKNP